MKTVHNHGEFPCDEIDCQFIGFSESTLKKHIGVFHGNGHKVPSKNNHLPCKYRSCSFMGDKPSKLERHYQIHENRLPYCCNFCTYRASNPDYLALHMLYHFKIRSFECNLCPSQFYTNNELNFHKRVHTHDYMCPHCHETFKSTTSMKKHITTCATRLEKFND